MSEFENIILCFLVPIVYVVTYIAGKYDVLYWLCKRIEEQMKEYIEEKEGLK